MSEYQQYSQAEVSILAVYTAVSQAEVHILAETRVYSQAIAVLNQGWGIGQAEVHILQTYTTYAQAGAILNQSMYVGQTQVHILTTYRAVAQAAVVMSTRWVYAQANVVINRHWGIAQAKVHILRTYRVYGLAHVILNQSKYVGQAQAWILRTYTLGSQAQAKLNSFDNMQIAQANAILNQAMQAGISQAKLNSFDYNQYAQAVTYVVIKYTGQLFLDTFSRTTTAPPFNLGSANTGQQWRYVAYSNRLAESATPIYADGSSFVLANPSYSYNYATVGGPPSIDSGDIYFDFYVPTSRMSWGYQGLYWYDKTWYINFWDNSGATLQLIGQSGIYYYPSITLNAWNRMHIKIVKSSGTNEFVQVRVWKVGDAEPQSWYTVQTVSSHDQLGPAYDYLGKPFIELYTPYYRDSNSGAYDYPPFKIDNLEIISTITQYINYGSGTSKAHIRQTYSQYAQAQVVIDQYYRSATTQAHILAFPTRYSQSQAFIKKSTGFALAQTKIAFPADYYRDKVWADGATHYYGMHVYNTSGYSNYWLLKDELGLRDSDDWNYGSYSATVASPVGPENIGLTLGYYLAYRRWGVSSTSSQIPEFVQTSGTWSYDGWVQAPSASPALATAFGLYLQSSFHYFDIYFGSVTNEDTAGTTINAFAGESGGTNTFYNTGVTFTPNSWYHIAVTYNNRTFKVYINGVLTNTISRPFWNPTGTTNIFNLGYSYYYGNGTGYVGGYDNLAIYPIELAQSTIQDHYERGQTRGFAQSQALLNRSFGLAQAAWYIFDPTPGAVNHWQQFGQAQAHILATSAQCAHANARITDAKDQNVYGSAHAIIIPQQGLLRYFIQGSTQNYSLPDQGTYAQITSMTAVTDPAQISEGDWGSNYGVRWQSWFVADMTGPWFFQTRSDDGSGIFIYNEQNQLVGSMNNGYGTGQGATTRNGYIDLVAGTKYKIDVKHAEGGSGAEMTAWYSRPGGSTTSPNLLLAGEAPWNDKSKLPVVRYWGMGLANTYWVQVVDGWYRFPRWAQAQAKIYYAEQKGYGQATVQIGAIRPAQAVTRTAGTGKYEYEVELDVPQLYLKLRESSASSPAANQIDTISATYGSQVTPNQTGPLTTPLNDPDSRAAYLNTDNTNSRITLPASKVYQDAFTIELWAKADNNTITIQTEATSGNAGTSGQRYLWTPDQKGSNAGLGVSVGTNGIGVYEHGSSYLAPLAVYSGTLGTSWHHIVVTEYQKVAKIYLDGVLVRTGLTSTKTIIYSPSIIGYAVWGSKWTGSIAEVAVYNSVLTPERILAHFLANTGKQQYAQAQPHIKVYGRNEYAQATVQVGAFWPAQAQAHIHSYDVSNSGQAHALIQTDYGLTRMTWNNAQWVVGDIFAWGDIEGLTLGNPNYANGTVPTSFPGDGNWGMAWSGNFIADVTGTWQFQTTSDDGSEVYISGTRVVDNGFGTGHGTETATGSISLVQGNFYTIHARWGQGGGPWNISIYYKRPADTNWNFLTDNAPPWIRRYYHAGYAQARAVILPVPNVKVHAQAEAKLNSFNYPQRAQATADILQTYQKYAQAHVVLNRGWGLAQARTLVTVRTYKSAQALAHIGWLQLAQAQAKLNAFGVTKQAHTKAHIKVYGVQRYAQSKAIISHTVHCTGLASVSIKQTYPFRYISTNYALPSLGVTITPDPDFSTEGTLPENVLDGDIYSVWTNFLAIDATEDIYFYLTIDFGILRTITSYYILPVDYNVTADLQYSVNNTDWSDAVTGIYFDVNTVSPLSYADAITGEINSIRARYWRLKFINGGDDNQVSIATFQLGTATTQNPTFAQAQAFFGHFGVAQALTYISPGLSTNWGQSQAQILQTYSGFGNAQFWYLPPTVFGLAIASIVQVYQAYGQAMVWYLPPTVFGVSQASILTTYTIHGQSVADIQTTYPKHAGAKVFITKTSGYAQATALIIWRTGNRGNAMVYIGHFKHGLASAFIIKNKIYAQALTIIKQDYSKYSQALALLRRSEVYSQSGTAIKRTYSVYGQSLTITNQHRMTAQARTSCVHTYTYTAQALCNTKATVSQHSQAQVIIRRRWKVSGQAQAFINRRSIYSGLALAQIGAFKYAVAQARIIAFNVPKSGLAAGYILVDTNVPSPYPASNLQSYLVMYNNHTLPGYVQREFISSVARLFTTHSAYVDKSLTDYLGLENKEINLGMLVWEPTYLECKIRVQEAATMLRSKRRAFGKLYLQYFDRYYEAMPKSITTDKAVATSSQILEYNVTFEAKPWLISNELYVLTGTGVVETTGRTLMDGGWTPTLIMVSGTDITISAVTEYGEDAGSVTISGTVSNYIIDSINFETSDNTLITPTDYGIYVGPGKTTFTITGATSCRIEYHNRWYI